MALARGDSTPSPLLKDAQRWVRKLGVDVIILREPSVKEVQKCLYYFRKQRLYIVCKDDQSEIALKASLWDAKCYSKRVQFSHRTWEPGMAWGKKEIIIF